MNRNKHGDNISPHSIKYTHEHHTIYYIKIALARFITTYRSNETHGRLRMTKFVCISQWLLSLALFAQVLIKTNVQKLRIKQKSMSLWNIWGMYCLSTVKNRHLECRYKKTLSWYSVTRYFRSVFICQPVKRFNKI